MAFPRSHLHENEQIVIDRSPHWWYLTPRALLLVVASALGIWALVYDFEDGSRWQQPVRVIVGLLVAAAFLNFLVRFIQWRATHFVITTDRCIYRSGVLKKSGIEIPLERINTVLFSQTVFERILGAGDIAIESAGEGSRQNFSDVSNPVQVQNMIYRQIEENENRKYDRIGVEAREAAAASAAASGIPQPTAVLSVAEQLHKLAELRDRGVITDAQFETQKRTLLGE
ncbi:MAG TPA: PH domain-containing protein [Microthrixaceae bacterium]|nr:PH domain-containing protein [Microthrixaceae bacterium]